MATLLHNSSSSQWEGKRSNRTLRQLRGKWRGNRDEVEIVGAVVDGHLLALSQVGRVAVALVAELVQCEPAVHQHSWARKGKSYAHLLDRVMMKPHESESRLLFCGIPEFYPSTRSWKLPLTFRGSLEVEIEKRRELIMKLEFKKVYLNVNLKCFKKEWSQCHRKRIHYLCSVFIQTINKSRTAPKLPDLK